MIASVLGYEVLARSRFFGLKDPHSMFAAAKVLDLEAELSRILRDEGIRSGQILPPDHVLFVNTHPAEIDDLELLIFSLGELRNLEPDRPACARNSRSGRNLWRANADAAYGA